MIGEKLKWGIHEGESTDARHRLGSTMPGPGSDIPPGYSIGYGLSSFLGKQQSWRIQSLSHRRHRMNHLRRFCLMLLMIDLLLFGCTTVGPDFLRPKANVAPNWMETGERVRNEPADYRNWWHAFNDQILNRLIDRAYRENLSLKIAGVRVLEARAQLGIAAGGFYPQTQQAFGFFQYNKTSERAPLATVLPRSLLEFRQAEIGLLASWELDFWGKFRRAIESADATLLATVADYDNALVSLTADVANTFIEIRTLEKRLRIARENVETQKKSLQIAEVRFQYGIAPELDVEQAKTVLHDTAASIPSLETQLRQAKNALSVLLGLPPGDLVDLREGSQEIPVSPPQVVVGMPADLLRRRPDIRSAEQQAAAQCARIGVAKSDLYPALSLTGTFGFLSSDAGKFSLSDMFQWRSRTAQAGPTFQWNIFNYGRITNNVKVQDARFQELLIAYQDAVLKAQQEVENNLAAFLRAQERAESLVQSTAAAKKSLDLAVLLYQAGLSDFTTVLISQKALLDEQDKLAVTLGNISNSLVGVYRALGGGWEIREGKDLVPKDIEEEMAKRTNWGKLLAPALYHPPASEGPKSLIRAPDW
jgi:NodT family efflux transporter outer membrane factor (OMF) lipoprotein